MSISLLETALAYAKERNWYVFPVAPGNKLPTFGSHGLNDATVDIDQIKLWWTKNPNYNIGLNCGLSGIAVKDVDHGFVNQQEVVDFTTKYHIPKTYVVRSGRRPEIGLHFYFAGTMPTINYKLDAVTGQIKSEGGYVLAAGSLHPSGKRYQLLADRPLAPLPDWMRKLKPINPNRIITDDTPKVLISHRHDFLKAYGRLFYLLGLEDDNDHKDLSETLEKLYRRRCIRDANFESRIANGELRKIAEWCPKKPLTSSYKLCDVDFVALQRAFKADPKIQQAYNGQLDLFDSDPFKAQDYLINGLRSNGCRTEQIIRIGETSPLNAATEAPEYLRGV